jgi:hypothetical protein
MEWHVMVAKERYQLWLPLGALAWPGGRRQPALNAGGYNHSGGWFQVNAELLVIRPLVHPTTHNDPVVRVEIPGAK